MINVQSRPTPRIWDGPPGIAAEDWFRLGVESGGTLQRDRGADLIADGPLRDRVGGYWKFDEEAGTRVDATGNGGDLDEVTGPTSTDGVLNKALLVSGFIRTSNSRPSLTFDPDDGFTFATWFRRTTVGTFGEILFTFTHGGCQFQCVNGQDPGLPEPELFRFFQSSGGTTPNNNFFAAPSPSHGFWIFVVAWLDPSDLKLRISLNGITHTTSGLAAPLAAATGSLEIQATLGFALDELGFWPFVLTDDQRTHLYNAGAGRTW